MASIHANSAREAITKLCTLPLLAGDNVTSAICSPRSMRRQLTRLFQHPSMSAAVTDVVDGASSGSTGPMTNGTRDVAEHRPLTAMFDRHSRSLTNRSGILSGREAVGESRN